MPDNDLAFKTTDELYEVIKDHTLPRLDFDPDEGELVTRRGFKDGASLRDYHEKVGVKDREHTKFKVKKGDDFVLIKRTKTYWNEDSLKVDIGNVVLDGGYKNPIERLRRLKERFDGYSHTFLVDRYSQNVYGEKVPDGYFKFMLSLEWL